MTPKIAAFAGSTRSASFNKQLVAIAADAARAAGAEVTVIDLRDLALPLFDQDLEDWLKLEFELTRAGGERPPAAAPSGAASAPAANVSARAPSAPVSAAPAAPALPAPSARPAPSAKPAP